jgi:hypothetical protein
VVYRNALSPAHVIHAQKQQTLSSVTSPSNLDQNVTSDMYAN